MQAKVELYGLMRVLQAVRVFIVGLVNLTVEVNAKYIKGMLNHPDIQPNMTINRWIAAIHSFHFKLVHVPVAKHMGADGLLQRPAAPGEEEEEEEEEEEGDIKEWIDRMAGLLLEAMDDSETWFGAMAFGGLMFSGEVVEEIAIPRTAQAEARDRQVEEILRYLMEGCAVRHGGR